MTGMGRSSRAISVGAAIAILGGCGGGAQLPIGAPGASTDSGNALVHYRTFKYTGAKQSFTVPAGVTHVRITAYGARGAIGQSYFSGYASGGGAGAIVTATIPVTPGERLTIRVGGGGFHDGFNGGGGVAGRSCHKYCYGFGGGASDVRQGGDRLTNRVVVAAGGGGGGADGFVCTKSSCGGQPAGGGGGSGGGLEGGSGDGGYGSDGVLGGGGGSGGTQSTGGLGGASGGASGCGGSDGTLGAGGPGANSPSGCGGNGGGGGGGYYGGGGGGAGGATSTGLGGAGGGGGGGSSYAESGATRVKMTAGANDKENGSIFIRW